MNSRLATKQQVLESIGVRTESSSASVRHLKTHPKNEGRRLSRDVGSVEISMVIPDPTQPRTEFDVAELERLADSIRDKGQLCPIRVRWCDNHEKWVIIAGERRWRATRKAGLSTIDAHFHDAPLTDSEILEQQIIENCLRESLRPIEEAKAYRRLIELNGWTGKQVAEALRVAPAKVSRGLALLKLPMEVQSQIEEGKLSARSGYEISKLKNPSVQKRVAETSIERDLGHISTARAVKQRAGVKPKKSPPTQVFATEVGLRVSVSRKAATTYPEIEAALQEAIEEVRHRIKNGMQLF